jgi:hypothetical protein
MNDDELDQWLLSRNSRLTERLYISVDVEERLRDTLSATRRPSPPASRSRAAFAAAAAASVLLVVISILSGNHGEPGPSLAPAVGRPSQPMSALTSQSAYQPVTGPGGSRTVVPTGWIRSEGPGPGAIQYTDPGNSGRFVRFGGALTTTEDPLTTRLADEETFASDNPRYERIDLSSISVHGLPGVRWEFEYDSLPEIRWRVLSVYWLANHHEYVVYGSAPNGEWAEMADIVATMLGRATP